MERHDGGIPTDVEEVIEADSTARRIAHDMLAP
jgi:hypothetical protein